MSGCCVNILSFFYLLLPKMIVGFLPKLCAGCSPWSYVVGNVSVLPTLKAWAVSRDYQDAEKARPNWRFFRLSGLIGFSYA